LREEESRCPIGIHVVIFDPLSKEYDSFDEIIDPRGERFERRIGSVLPYLRYFLIKEG
jgi:hypothetical protein